MKSPQQLVAEFFISFLLSVLAGMHITEFTANTLRLVLTVPAYFKHVSGFPEDTRNMSGCGCSFQPVK